MKKILVFIYDEMADYELTFLAQLLGGDLGKKIITIANEDKIIRSKSGILYKPEALVKDVNCDDVEGIIIAGGWKIEFRSELTNLIQKLNQNGSLLAGICLGPIFFAEAGVLSNKKYTTSAVEWTENHKERFGEKDMFPRENFVNERVVRDQNVITAKGFAFIDFAIEVVDYFNGFDDENDRREFEKLIKG